MQNGVYMLINAFGKEYLFLDIDSSLEDVISFAHRYNQKSANDQKFISLKYKEGIVEIQDKI